MLIEVSRRKRNAQPNQIPRPAISSGHGAHRQSGRFLMQLGNRLHWEIIEQARSTQ
jgi:hypothetical protein